MSPRDSCLFRQPLQSPNEVESSGSAYSRATLSKNEERASARANARSFESGSSLEDLAEGLGHRHDDVEIREQAIDLGESVVSLTVQA
jgi:hypothetical protein